MATSLLAAMLAGCIPNTVTADGRVSNSATPEIGSTLGDYLLADIIGGRSHRADKVANVGVAALTGDAVDDYMDRQERELRFQLAGHGVRVTRHGNDLVLNVPSGMTFPIDGADVQPQFRPTLGRVARVLALYDQTYVDVYGHTDSSGPDHYNNDLSNRRATAVADYLVLNDVQPARIGVRGFGETQPIASNGILEGRAANRRVEIKIVPIQEHDLGFSSRDEFQMPPAASRKVAAAPTGGILPIAGDGAARPPSRSDHGEDRLTGQQLTAERTRVGTQRFTASDYKPATIRHIVLFRYKPTVTQVQRGEIRRRFRALAQATRRDGSRYIVSIEAGAQGSGEALDHGFTDAFIVTFASEGDRNYYVGLPIVTDPHFFDPVHHAFKAYVGPFLAKDGVLVFDLAVD